MATLLFCASTFLFKYGNAGFGDWFDDVIHKVEDVVRSAEQWEQEFEDHLSEFKDFFDGDMSSDEKAVRLGHYKKNVAFIEEGNAAAALKGLPAPMAINAFALMDEADIPRGAIDEDDDGPAFRRAESDFERRRQTHAATRDNFGHAAQHAPDEWNWRTHNNGAGVRWVKYQRCHNCWAHAAAAALETRNYVANGISADLSVNFIADCMHAEGGRSGCIGGKVTWGFQMAIDQGLPSTSNYMSSQHSASKSFATILGDNTVDETCRVTPRGHVLDAPGSAVKATEWFRVTSWEEFKWEIFNNGACALNIGTDSHISFAGRSMLIWTPDAPIDHSVTAVGYGSESGVQYIVAKNSWGTGWGDGGYFRVKATQWSAASSAKFKVYCPKVKPNGAGAACKDGEIVSGGRFGYGDVTRSRRDLADSQRSFSSVKDNSRSGAGLARSKIDSTTAWVAGDNGAGMKYIVLDMYNSMSLAGFTTQGRHDSDEWVEYYEVQTSLDAVNWSPLPSLSGGPVYFKGNNDRDTKVTNMWDTSRELEIIGDENRAIPPPQYPRMASQAIVARYVRFIPKQWHAWPSMRVELLVYTWKGCFCSGVTCTKGQVCSYERGCVSPAPGTVQDPNVNHVHNDHTDPDSVSDEADDVTSVAHTVHVNLGDQTAAAAPATTNTLETTPSLTTTLTGGDSKLWKVAGPISVFVNCVMLGCVMGALALYCLMSRQLSPIGPNPSHPV